MSNVRASNFNTSRFLLCSRTIGPDVATKHFASPPKTKYLMAISDPKCLHFAIAVVEFWLVAALTPLQ